MPRIQGQFVGRASEEDAKVSEPKTITLDNLRDVILLGRLTDKVQIGGFIFEVSTLSAAEQKEIVSKVLKMQTENKMFDIRPVTVAFCLRNINGTKIEDLCEDLSIMDIIDRRIDVIMNMQTNLVDKIFRVYENLLEESNRQIGLEEIKK